MKIGLYVPGFGWIDAEFVAIPRAGESIWLETPRPQRWRIAEIAWSSAGDPHLYLAEITAPTSALPPKGK